MQTQFIRLGNYTINLNAISYINWDCTVQVIDGKRLSNIRLYLKDSSAGSADNFGMDWVEFGSDSSEGKALKSYFNNPDRVTDLMPNDEVEQWQYYKSLGGEMLYEDWLSAFKTHKELIKRQGEWSDTYLQRVSELEAKLLH